MIDTAKSCSSPLSEVSFDISNYPAKLSVVDAIKGQSGWLTLQHVIVESFEREELLLFSAFTDAGKSIDQETCEKLFNCRGTVSPVEIPRDEVKTRLDLESQRHQEAAIALSMENNNKVFSEERERLEKWADDMTIAAEKDLQDTKMQIKAVRRQCQIATTLDEQGELQKKLSELERKQRKQRQEIFEIEDKICEKRDALIQGLQRRMKQKTHSTSLFSIRWKVI